MAGWVLIHRCLTWISWSINWNSTRISLWMLLASSHEALIRNCSEMDSFIWREGG
jgi:hypothetical protein